MSIGPIPSSDFSPLSASALLRAGDARNAPSAENLTAATGGGGRAVFGALSPDAADARRRNDLMAAARAAAVSLVVAPLATAPMQSAKSTAEIAALQRV